MRARAAYLLLLLALAAAGCADQNKGTFQLRLLPLHLGRNPVEDPFELVSRVELGLLDEQGHTSSLGTFSPLARFGPGLVRLEAGMVPYLLGLNDLERPVSAGYAPPLQLLPNRRQVLPLPFARLDSVVATRLLPEQTVMEDPFAGHAPALRLDSSYRQSGQAGGDDDLSALLWLLWEPDRLHLRVRVRDEQVQAAGEGQSLDQGDAVKVYLEAGTLLLAADGRYQASGLQPFGEPGDRLVGGGYQLDFVLPVTVTGKNQPLPFDLRVIDSDGAGPETVLTWRFDPRSQQPDPAPEDYGRLVPAAPLLPALEEDLSPVYFAGNDGPVQLGGSWDDQELRLSATVPDNEVLVSGRLEDDDRVVFRLDLANAVPPVAEPLRVVSLTVSAGSLEAHSGGNLPGSLEPDAFAFTGQASGTTLADGYRVDVRLPWADLGLEPGQPQRGWFLGLQVSCIDSDSDATTSSDWSAGTEAIELWPELFLDRSSL